MSYTKKFLQFFEKKCKKFFSVTHKHIRIRLNLLAKSTTSDMIYMKKAQNFMENLIPGLVNPNFDRHILKIVKKLKKKSNLYN